ITEALRGAGAYLVDERGERFVDELLPRDQVALAIARHPGRAYITATHLDPDLLRTGFPNFVRNCAGAGIDPFSQPVPVRPAAHYTMGGVVTDLDGRTSVDGLLAAGECARTGVHGANRLASNSLLEAATFGRRAARAATRLSQRASGASTRTHLWRRGPLTVSRVGRLLDEQAGVLRTGVGLESALASFRLGATSEPAADAVEMATLICAAALARPRSIGAHRRLDGDVQQLAV